MADDAKTAPECLETVPIEDYSKILAAVYVLHSKVHAFRVLLVAAEVDPSEDALSGWTRTDSPAQGVTQALEKQIGDVCATLHVYADHVAGYVGRGTQQYHISGATEEIVARKASFFLKSMNNLPVVS